MSKEFFDELIRDGNATIMPEDVAARLNARINEFPWLGCHVAWHELPKTSKLHWGRSSDEDAARFVRGLSIGQFECLCTFYSGSDLVLKFETDWLVENLDLAAANKEQYFLFGCDDSGVHTQTFAELVTGRTIWGWTSQ